MKDEQVQKQKMIRHKLSASQNQAFSLLQNRGIKAVYELQVLEAQTTAKREMVTALEESSRIFLNCVIQDAGLGMVENGYAPNEFSAGQFELVGTPKELDKT